MRMPRIETIQELVANYHICGYSLRMEDLEGLTDEQKTDFELFFDALEGIKGDAKALREETGEVARFAEIEDAALEYYMKQYGAEA
jgi:hypothetical protein